VSVAGGEEVCADRLKVAANKRAAMVLEASTVAFLLAIAAKTIAIRMPKPVP
jgi:hypothetical protein